MTRRKSGRAEKAGISLLAALLLLSVLFIVYVQSYYHAAPEASEALLPDADVLVSRTDYGWLFDGPGQADAVIFYPGAKVEETAYAPLLRRLAEEGVDACLVKMPFRLAVFGSGKAEDILRAGGYTRWYMAGHSLGGAMAAGFAASHADLVDGVILLAAYSTEKLDEELDAVLIYGSEDTVLNRVRYGACLENLPAGAAEHVIPGGNHAQFGAYGPQKGDGAAAISREEQEEETVAVILDALRNQSPAAPGTAY